MLRIFKLGLLFVIFLSFTGCHTGRKALIRQEISKAEMKLGLSISKSDPLHLYLEAASWVGTPYRSGGTSKRGADCSGFTYSLYQNIYRKALSRNSAEMYSRDCIRIRRKSKLKAGDLVFFRTGSQKQINHVGVYLKNNYFIHSATRGGVQVNSLNEPYYQRTYYRSGRVR
ncbi:MAG: C40 family peptidase [Bacteroidales bacterium]